MSLGMRAVVALVLMVAFYAAVIGAVAGLVYLAAHLALQLENIHNGRALVFAIAVVLLILAAACVILWSALPRWDRFQPPGPELIADDQPRLFEVLREVARATGQDMPRHVYLVLALNAAVSQRGGVLGIGSKRVMIVGLPLLHLLTVNELRGVLAHEMGHFVAGDTAMSPWIYKTRAAMVRILVNITRLGNIHEAVAWGIRVLRLPFHGFLLGYMRITEAISRAQELSADALAVEVAGARAVRGGLEKTHTTDFIYDVYFDEEVVPALAAGMLPPIGEGLVRFLEDPAVANLREQALAKQLADPQASPYDSHPPLRDRLAAVRDSIAAHTDDMRPAVELLENPRTLEEVFFREAKLKPTAWEDVPAGVAVRWRDRVAKSRKLLARYRIDSLPVERRAIYEVAVEELGMVEADQLSSLEDWWIGFTGTAIAVILLDEGFTLSMKPRESIRLVRDDLAIEVFEELGELVAGKIEHDAWNARWARRGLQTRALA